MKFCSEECRAKSSHRPSAARSNGALRQEEIKDKDKTEDSQLRVDINSNACALCGLAEAPSMKLKRCGRCVVVAYCSAAHQQEHWPEHKKICRKLAAQSKEAKHSPTAAAAQQQGQTSKQTDETVDYKSQPSDDSGFRPYAVRSACWFVGLICVCPGTWHALLLSQHFCLAQASALESRRTSMGF